jgi:exonuclease VII large subunit
LWEKAGFGSYVISGSATRDKILKLQKKYSSLHKMKSLNWSSSEENYTQLQRQFTEDSEKLLDVSVARIEERIRGDRHRSQEAKDEDIEFLNDQKGDRMMYISEELDEQYENSLKNKETRHRKMEELRTQKEEKTVEHLQNVQVSTWTMLQFPKQQFIERDTRRLKALEISSDRMSSQLSRERGFVFTLMEN